LPDGTKIEKAASLDLVQSDYDDQISQEYNDEDEGIPDPKDTVINNSKKWYLPSGLNVGEIIDENVSANAKKAKNKKKLTIYEKAILRYGASNIIDLSVMSEWFLAKDIKFMAKNYADLLKVPLLSAEENLFISKVESVCILF
jgi:hypothetical protein